MELNEELIGMRGDPGTVPTPPTPFPTPLPLLLPTLLPLPMLPTTLPRDPGDCAGFPPPPPLPPLLLLPLPTPLLAPPDWRL